jgi:hypothetical protein
MPEGVVGIGMASFFPTAGSRAQVTWLSRDDIHKGHVLSRLVDQLDSEFPDLLEKARVRSVLFTTDDGAPPYLGGVFLSDERQIRILRTMKTLNRVGSLIVVHRSQSQMYYTLIHEIAHSLSNEFTLAREYKAHFKLAPHDWIRTLSPVERGRWVRGVTKYKIALEDRDSSLYDELFADACTDYLVAGTSDNEDMDGWVRGVLGAERMLDKIDKMRSKRTPSGFTGRNASAADIEHFLISAGEQAGEGLSPDELNHVVAVYSIRNK